MSSGTLGGRILFWKFFSFSYRFRKLSENFSTYSRKVFVGFVTTASYMSSGIIGGRILFCRTFFPIVFATLSKKFSNLSKRFRRVCHNCILHVFRNNWRKHTFSVKLLLFSIILGQGSKKLRPIVEKFSWRLSQLPPSGKCPQEHLEEEYFSENFLFFPIVFGHWAKSVRPFFEKFLSGLSQVHLTCL